MALSKIDIFLMGVALILKFSQGRLLLAAVLLDYNAQYMFFYTEVLIFNLFISRI